MAGPFAFKSNLVKSIEGETLKKLVSVLVGLILISGIAGCSNGDTEDKSKSIPTPSESTETKFDGLAAMDRGKPKLIQNDLDAEFLEIAANSCKKALADGLVIEDAESTSYFLPEPQSERMIFKFKEALVTDGVVGGANYLNYWPALFDPCDTMMSADLVKPTDDNYAILEHSLEKTTQGNYKWGQHHGGANLDVIEYSVGSDGLISGYGTSDWSSAVRYGPLSQQELGYFK